MCDECCVFIPLHRLRSVRIVGACLCWEIKCDDVTTFSSRIACERNDDVPPTAMPFRRQPVVICGAKFCRCSHWKQSPANRLDIHTPRMDACIEQTIQQTHWPTSLHLWLVLLLAVYYGEHICCRPRTSDSQAEHEIFAAKSPPLFGLLNRWAGISTQLNCEIVSR